jgi:hypothetical protein
MTCLPQIWENILHTLLKEKNHSSTIIVPLLENHPIRMSYLTNTAFWLDDFGVCIWNLNSNALWPWGLNWVKKTAESVLDRGVWTGEKTAESVLDREAWTAAKTAESVLDCGAWTGD